jgi:hypothetical protein
MNIKYQQWIDNFVSDHNGCVIGLCCVAVKKMKEAFPELEVQRGFRYPGGEHWWLKTADGTIIDPTENQFYSDGEYKQFEPGDEVRIGKCMNCGWELYDTVESLDVPSKKDTSFCDKDCRKEFADYLNRGYA